MPFDNSLILRDGSVDLDTNEVVAVSTTANDDGAKVLDLGGTCKPRGGNEGVMDIAAVMVLPDIPTTYADTLAVEIQQSDHETFGYETLVTFPTLYAYTRLLKVTVTTAFVSSDIGATLTGVTTGDTGVIRWIHPDLLTVGKVGYIIVTMVGSDDLFDDEDETLTSSDTGVATMSGVAIVEPRPTLGGPNHHVRRCAITKRYVRGSFTPSAGSNFGGAQLMLQPWAHGRM
jgi:hypothetical protein